MDVETAPNVRSHRDRGTVGVLQAAMLIGLTLLAVAAAYFAMLRNPGTTMQAVGLETSAQVAENAKFLNILASLPKSRRGACMYANKDKTRQVAYSPDLSQKREIYALIGQPMPAGK